MKSLEAELALALQGPNFLGHRRGVSNSSAVLPPPGGGRRRSQSLPKEIHTLDPVPESDLEKGVSTPEEGDVEIGAASTTDDSRESGRRIKRDVEVV